MPRSIDVSSTLDVGAALGDSAAAIEVLIEAQADRDAQTYELIAERRAQLEDAETLRRVRAL